MLKREHEAAEERPICFEEFNDTNNKNVRNHCHYTRLYQAAAHKNCNRNIDIRPHNRYVSHMFHKDDIGVTVEKKFMYISFNFKIITQRT